MLNGAHSNPAVAAVLLLVVLASASCGTPERAQHSESRHSQRATGIPANLPKLAVAGRRVSAKPSASVTLSAGGEIRYSCEQLPIGRRLRLDVSRQDAPMAIRDWVTRACSLPVDGSARDTHSRLPVVRVALDERTSWGVATGLLDGIAAAGPAEMELVFESTQCGGARALRFRPSVRESPPPGYGSDRFRFTAYALCTSDGGKPKCWLYGWASWLARPAWPGAQPSESDLAPFLRLLGDDFSRERVLNRRLCALRRVQGDEMRRGATTWISTRIRCDTDSAHLLSYGELMDVLAQALPPNSDDVVIDGPSRWFRTSEELATAPEATAVHDEYRRRLEGRRPAVNEGLLWLHDHQVPDGAWSVEGCESPRQGESGSSSEESNGSQPDSAATALAVLALLGSGHDGLHGHPFSDDVHEGLSWLLREEKLGAYTDSQACRSTSQSETRAFHYAAPLLTLVVGYRVRPAPPLRDAAQHLLDRAAKEVSGGRLCGVGGGATEDELLSVGLIGLSFSVAEAANGAAREEGAASPFRLDAAAVTDLQLWARTAIGVGSSASDGCADGATLDSAPRSTVALETAVATAILTFSSPAEGPGRAVAGSGAELLVAQALAQEERASSDPAYWLLGSLALRELGGRDWRVWNEALMGVVRRAGQPCSCVPRRQGAYRSPGASTRTQGRVEATALGVMLADLYYGVERVCGQVVERPRGALSAALE